MPPPFKECPGVFAPNAPLLIGPCLCGSCFSIFPVRKVISSSTHRFHAWTVVRNYVWWKIAMEGNIFRTVDDFKQVAAKRMTPEAFGFIESAAGEQSLKENTEAFRRWRFRPLLLRDVQVIDTTTTVLGAKLPFPICIAPTGLHKEANIEGEVATAKAAEAVGIGMAVSIVSNCKMEDVARQAPNCIRWCHVPITKNYNMLKRYMQRAEENGFGAFIVTIDQRVSSQRHFRTADGISFNWNPGHKMETAESLTSADGEKDVHELAIEILCDCSTDWSDIEWIKKATSLPVAVKGVLTAEMAKEAVDHGVDAIIVSNHGGRQLNSTFATIDSLPEVVRAVDGKCDVYFDGGVRSGEDVAKALALGANAVFIGRPVMWGLAVDGANGAQKLLEMLRNEFEVALRLLGVKSIKELQETPNLVVHENYLFSKLGQI